MMVNNENTWYKRIVPPSGEDGEENEAGGGGGERGCGRVEVRVGARCCGKPGTQGSWCPACCAIHSAFVLGCSELPCDADGHRGSEPRFQGDCSVWCENRQYLQDSLLSDILTTGSSGRCSVVVFSMQIFTMLRTRKGFFFFFSLKCPTDGGSCSLYSGDWMHPSYNFNCA